MFLQKESFAELWPLLSLSPHIARFASVRPPSDLLLSSIPPLSGAASPPCSSAPSSALQQPLPFHISPAPHPCTPGRLLPQTPHDSGPVLRISIATTHGPSVSQCYVKDLSDPARFPEPESWLPGTKELHCPLDQSAKTGYGVCGGISHLSAPAAGDSPTGEGMTWNRIDGTASTFRISVSPRI